MKYFLVCFLLLSACSKKTTEQYVETKKQNQSAIEQQAKIVKPVENQSGTYELFLGIHQIEYFADRMVLKAKLSGYDFAKKTSFEKNGVTNYQVILGPFNSQSEAEAADKAIKERAPDLDISKVRAIQ